MATELYANTAGDAEEDQPTLEQKADSKSLSPGEKLTISEICMRTGLSKSYVYKKVCSLRLSWSKVGKTCVYTLPEDCGSIFSRLRNSSGLNKVNCSAEKLPISYFEHRAHEAVMKRSNDCHDYCLLVKRIVKEIFNQRDVKEDICSLEIKISYICWDRHDHLEKKGYLERRIKDNNLALYVKDIKNTESYLRRTISSREARPVMDFSELFE